MTGNKTRRNNGLCSCDWPTVLDDAEDLGSDEVAVMKPFAPQACRVKVVVDFTLHRLTPGDHSEEHGGLGVARPSCWMPVPQDRV